VARHLESLGHEAIAADPNYAPMYANRSRRTKSRSTARRKVSLGMEAGMPVDQRAVGCREGPPASAIRRDVSNALVSNALA
jgi:hypothetical protein